MKWCLLVVAEKIINPLSAESLIGGAVFACTKYSASHRQNHQKAKSSKIASIF